MLQFPLWTGHTDHSPFRNNFIGRSKLIVYGAEEEKVERVMMNGVLISYIRLYRLREAMTPGPASTTACRFLFPPQAVRPDLLGYHRARLNRCLGFTGKVGNTKRGLLGCTLAQALGEDKRSPVDQPERL